MFSITLFYLLVTRNWYISYHALHCFESTRRIHPKFCKRIHICYSSIYFCSIPVIGFRRALDPNSAEHVQKLDQRSAPETGYECGRPTDRLLWRHQIVCAYGMLTGKEYEYFKATFTQIKTRVHKSLTTESSKATFVFLNSFLKKKTFYPFCSCKKRSFYAVNFCVNAA